MVIVAQLVRASDCGSEGRGFEPHLSPLDEKRDFDLFRVSFFCFNMDGIVNYCGYICSIY